MTAQPAAPKQSEPPPETLRIGIYGCTSAGKTTFLHALLEYWTAQKQIIPKNTAVLEFMQRTAAEVEAYGGVRPTTAESTDLSFTLHRDKNDGDLDITCRDLRGELLADDLEATTRSDGSGPLRRQIKECDAFLFFFDPTAKEHRADAEKHYDREFDRAEKFLDAVLATRENRYLPIVFVLTHHDQWQRDADVIANVQRWKTRVIDRMSEIYRSRYRSQRPKVLTNREQIFVETAATEQTTESNRRLTAVIHRLAALSRRCKNFGGRLDFWKVVALASIAIVIPVMLWLLSRPGNQDPPPIPNTTVAQQLKRHEAELEGSVPADQSQITTYAKKLHDILVDLRTWSDGQAKGNAKPTARDVTKAASMLETAARKLIGEGNAVSQDRDTRLKLLGVALGGLRAPADATSDPLEPAVELYWRLADEKARATLRATVKERDNVGSHPKVTLRTLADQAAELKSEFETHAVATTPEGTSLMDQLRDSQTFCDDRAADGTYTVAVTTQGDQKKGGTAPLEARRVILESGGRSIYESTLALDRERSNVRISAALHWGGDAQETSHNLLELRLRGSDYGNIMIYKKDGVESNRDRSTSLGDRDNLLRTTQSINVALTVKYRKKGIVWDDVMPHGEIEEKDVALDQLLQCGSMRLPLVGTGARGNKLELKASLLDAGRFQPTKAGSQEVAVPLGSSLRCLVYIGDASLVSDAKPIIDFNPIAKDGPLAVLGMPLFQSRAQTMVTAQDRDTADNFTVSVTFNRRSVAPDLLWDVTTEAIGENP